MAKSTPTIRVIHWPSVVLQVLFLALLIQILSWAGITKPLPFIVGPIIFLLLSFGMRYWLGRDHQLGMKSIRMEQFHAAFDHFQESVNFFEKYPWVDRFRALTLFSASRMCFREMGMVNMAYCYGQMGRGEEMEKLYREVAKQYPDNPIARTVLDMIDNKREENE